MTVIRYGIDGRPYEHEKHNSLIAECAMHHNHKIKDKPNEQEPEVLPEGLVKWTNARLWVMFVKNENALILTQRTTI